MLDIKAGADFKHVGDYVRHNSYYDIDFNFKQMDLYGSDALDQSIENVIYTEFGERLFNFGFGSPVQAILFDNNYNTGENRNRIYQAIEKLVPISIDRTEANIGYYNDDPHILTVHFKYNSNDGLIMNHEFQRHIAI